MSDLPIGWEKDLFASRIERIIDNRGKTPPIEEFKTVFPLIEVNSIRKDEKHPDYNAISKFVSQETFNSWFRAGHPAMGDILMPTVGSIGNAAIMNTTHGSIAQNLIGVRIKEHQSAMFWYYYIISPMFRNQILKVQMNAVQPSLRVPHMKKFSVNIPPFLEQQKIAEILSTIDDKIDVIDQQITETQALKKGLMQRLLSKGIGHTDFKDSPLGKIPKSWFSSTIEKSCEIHNSKREPISAEIRKGMQGIYPYYGPTKAVDFINQYAFDGDYVLIGEDGDHFLKYENWSMTQFVHGKFNVNNHAHIITGKIGCLTEWIHYFFQHRDIVKFLTRQGAGRYKLTKAALMVMILVIPPVEEQKKIVEILSSVDEKLEVLEDKKTHYQELKQGLMQQLLTGKISVNGLINKTANA